MDIGKQAYNFPNLSVIYTSISRQYGDAAIDFGGKDKNVGIIEERKRKKVRKKRGMDGGKDEAKIYKSLTIIDCFLCSILSFRPHIM